VCGGVEEMSKQLSEKVQIKWTEEILDQIVDGNTEKAVTTLERELIVIETRALFIKNMLKKLKKEVKPTQEIVIEPAVEYKQVE
jgi:ketopantoate reductase